MVFGCFLPTSSSRFVIESLKSFEHKTSDTQAIAQLDRSREWISRFLPATFFDATVNDTSRSYHPGWVLTYVRF